MLSKLLVFGLVLFPLFPNKVIAQEYSYNSYYQEVVGYPLSPFEIKLSYSEGVSLNFTDLEDSVANLWLDNPNFATFVTNCSDNSGCQVTTVHLRRIQDLNIPNIPADNQTMLTLRFNSGKIIKFKLKKSTVSAQVLYEFKKENSRLVANNSVQVVLPVEKDYPLIYSILKGVSKAKKKELLTADSPLNSQLEIFINNLWAGQTEDEARIKADLSQDLIDTLKKMGNYVNYQTILHY